MQNVFLHERIAQGRIQDLKLGVAQKNWKIWKKGGCEDISNISIYIYISITIFFKYDVYYNTEYLKPPYTIMYWKKKYLKNFRGGARPVRPL